MVVDVGGAAPRHWGVEDSPLVWLVAFAGVCLEKSLCFLVHVVCVYGRIPGYSLQFLPPTQAASEQHKTGKARALPLQDLTVAGL